MLDECRKIEKKHRNRYDLDAILSMLLYTRILYPGSKQSSLEDAGRFIGRESCTMDGEPAQITSDSLNMEMVELGSRLDGFYAIATDLEDNAPAIIRANSGRWTIDDKVDYVCQVCIFSFHLTRC